MCTGLAKSMNGCLLPRKRLERRLESRVLQKIGIALLIALCVLSVALVGCATMCKPIKIVDRTADPNEPKDLLVPTHQRPMTFDPIAEAECEKTFYAPDTIAMCILNKDLMEREIYLIKRNKKYQAYDIWVRYGDSRDERRHNP